MADYGSWEDRPWGRREGDPDWERWRERREGRHGPWRGSAEEEPGARGGEERGGRAGEEWRPRGERYGEGMEGRGPPWRAGERGREWDPERRRAEGWERSEGRRGEWRPEIDPPWVERGPRARARGESRGLMEWEDRGPLAWLGDRVRRATRPSRGPKGYTRSDERIHDEVCERIARSGVDADEVEVRVEKREVTLAGTVGSREEKWWLEDLADDVFGVEEVHNHLRVSRERPAAPGGQPGMRH